MEFELIIRRPSNPNKCFRILAGMNNTIWINKEDGEGSEFDLEEFLDNLEKYYDKNF